ELGGVAGQDLQRGHAVRVELDDVGGVGLQEGLQVAGCRGQRAVQRGDAGLLGHECLAGDGEVGQGLDQVWRCLVEVPGVRGELSDVVVQGGQVLVVLGQV